MGSNFSSLSTWRGAAKQDEGMWHADGRLWRAGAELDGLPKYCHEKTAGDRSREKDSSLWPVCPQSLAEDGLRGGRDVYSRAYDNIGSKKWDKVMYQWKKMLQESFEELNRSHADGAAVPEPGHEWRSRGHKIPD